MQFFPLKIFRFLIARYFKYFDNIVPFEMGDQREKEKEKKRVEIAQLLLFRRSFFNL